MFAAALATALLQIAVPPPRGYVNDFAGVLDTATIQRLEHRIAEVREKTRGEIAVVTLGDLAGRAASDVALQIGRQWGVGATGEAGDPAKNLGVVVLLVPRRNHEPGTGDLFIATGRGAEGFLTDARVGRIRDAMIPALAEEDYGAGLETGVGLIAQAFATEYGATLEGTDTPTRPSRQRQGPPAVILFLFLWFVIFALPALRRRRRRSLWWIGGGPWGGGGGGGGFSGGGFGGFGGGGGFSGGGAGGKF